MGEGEARCLKNLELIGNVSLGLARSLSAVVGSDTATAARERLQPAWERTRRRFDELSKTAAAVFTCGERISLAPPVRGATAPCMAQAARPVSDGGAYSRKGEAAAHVG